jgi:hypothetical protein
VEIDTLSTESLEILENAPNPANRFVWPFHVYGVGSQVDPYT